MSLDRIIGSLQSRIAELALRQVIFRQATVVTANPLTVSLGGADDATPAVALSGVRPVAGDAVAVLSWGRDRLVIGKLGSGAPVWTTPTTFRTNYSDYGAGGDFSAGWRVRADGQVEMRGYVLRSASAWTAGDTMFTISVAPQQTVDRVVSCLAGSVGWANVRVTTAGAVIFRGSNLTWASGSVIGLDGVSFAAA